MIAQSYHSRALMYFYNLHSSCGKCFVCATVRSIPITRLPVWYKESPTRLYPPCIATQIAARDAALLRPPLKTSARQCALKGACRAADRSFLFRRLRYRLHQAFVSFRRRAYLVQNLFLTLALPIRKVQTNRRGKECDGERLVPFGGKYSVWRPSGRYVVSRA